MKRTLSTIVITSAVAASFGACTSYQMKYKDPSAQRGTKHEVKQTFFLYGLVGGSDVDLKSLCPAGVAEISSEHSVVDGLAFWLTAGLYAPTSVNVHCKSGQAYRIDKTEDSVEVAEIDLAQPNSHE